MSEPRENAIVRTICEYGVIHFDKDLAITDILDFFNRDYSRGTIVKYLDKYFTQISTGRHIKYANTIRLDNLDFKLARYYSC